MDTLTATFASHGFVAVHQVIDDSVCAEVAKSLEPVASHGAGTRRLLEQPWCQDLARRVRTNSVVAELLPDDAVAVQCTVFDKSPSTNWLVALHQDRSIPVRRRVEAAGLVGWSEKEGDIFVQPPASLLEQLISVRVHIDPCPVESGALRVVPGSHLSGILTGAESEKIRKLAGELVLPFSRGDALVLKPLLLHASSKASASMQRRVLHFVFGPRQLPLGLEWQHAI